MSFLFKSKKKKKKSIKKDYCMTLDEAHSQLAKLPPPHQNQKCPL